VPILATAYMFLVASPGSVAVESLSRVTPPFAEVLGRSSKARLLLRVRANLYMGEKERKEGRGRDGHIGSERQI
jgi:hypothetical protein